jgi:hypothetical protein
MTINIIEVAALIGDMEYAEISPATIGVLAGLYGDNSFTVAAAAARSIAAKYAGSVNKRAGDVSISGGDKHKQYLALAATLDRQAAVAGLGATSAYAGGISVSDKEAQEDDTDRVAPSFTRTLHDDPGQANDSTIGRDWA